jgi:hypothetical protein
MLETLVHLIELQPNVLTYLAIDIAIALLLLGVIRFLSGVPNGINVTHELGEKDNFAFGISVAGRMLALCMVLSAVVGRHIGLGFEVAAMGTTLFGAIGIILIKIGRIAHDKIVLHLVDKELAIRERNTSVAIVDASSAIASAIIIYGMINWVDGSDTNAIVGILSGFFIVLAILLLTTRLYEIRFARNNQNDSFQGMLRKDNFALAIQHSGNLIATAIVVSTAGSLLNYEAQTYVSNLTGWLVCGVAASLALAIVVGIAKRVVLFGLNWKEEVDMQGNVGLACIEWVLSVGIALIALGLV